MNKIAEQKKERITWIDVSRGVAFMMVIYSHLEYCNDSIMKYFSPIFLTTFFLVSGYLFKEGQPFKVVFEQRTRTLLLPLLILGSIQILMGHIASLNVQDSLSSGFKRLIFQDGEGAVLWFVAALYVFSLFFYWVERISTSDKSLFIIALSLFILNYVTMYVFDIRDIPWHIDGMGFAIFYMALGKLYKHHEAKIDKKVNREIVAVVAVIYAALVSISPYKINFFGSPILVDAFFISVIGLFVCVYISKLFISRDKLMMFVGANSLFYFAFHGKVYSVLQALTAKILVSAHITHTLALDTTLGFVITIADALILIIPAILVNRYAPFLLGKGFKLYQR